MSKVAFRHVLPLLWALLLFACPAGAQQASSEPLKELKAVWKAEKLDEEALISGAWLVGVHAIAPVEQNKPVLSAFIPGGWANHKICARTTSRDGLYSSLFQYDVPADWSGGPARLQYPSNFPERTGVIDLNTSGVIIHKGGCDRTPGEFLPAHWNMSSQPQLNTDGSRTIVFNLNAGRSDRIVGQVAIGGGLYPLNCSKIPAGGTSFNFTCKLLLPGSVHGDADMTIVRYRSGRAARPRTAKVNIPEATRR